MIHVTLIICKLYIQIYFTHNFNGTENSKESFYCQNAFELEVCNKNEENLPCHWEELSDE